MTSESTYNTINIDNTTGVIDSTDSPNSNSSQCNPTSEFMQALPWVRITFGILMVLENSVSLWALGHVHRMPHSVHCFIRSIAVAELLMGVWCCYRYGAEIKIGSEYVSFECRLRYIGTTYLNFATIFSICGLCLDRCLALLTPFRYAELVTKARVRMSLSVVWGSPLVVVLLAYVHTGGNCSDCNFAAIASQRTFVVLTVLRCLLIAVIVASQIVLFRAAHCHILKIFPSVLSARNSTRFMRMNARAAVTTAAVVFPFLVLYVPILVVQGILAAVADSRDYIQMLTTMWLFASAHGLFTPLIFCWRFKEVRNNIVRFCRLSVPPPEIDVYHLRNNYSSCTN